MNNPVDPCDIVQEARRNCDEAMGLQAQIHREQLNCALRALEDAAQEIDLLRAANHRLRLQVATATRRMLEAAAVIHAVRNDRGLEN